jgi:hypothetical protein
MSKMGNFYFENGSTGRGILTPCLILVYHFTYIFNIFTTGNIRNLKMLKSKTFVKKTRKGGVMKIVREHYLRDDIWCGVNGCPQCSQTEPVLEVRPESNSSLFNFPHFIVPDTNIALRQVTSA